MQLATLCYLRKNDQTLMLHRILKKNDVHANKWNGLGGKFNPGETPEECIIREVLEESGLRIKNPKLNGFLTFPQFSGGVDWYVFVFTAVDFSGNLINSPEGKLKWVDNHLILGLNLWEGDRIFLNWLNENRFFFCKI